MSVVMLENGEAVSSTKSSTSDQNEAQNEKKFKCSECNMSYKHASSLSKHKYTHKGTSFVCKFEDELGICGQSFSQKSNMTRHYKSHRGMKRIVCEICGHEA